ncbi:phage head closure protein [Romboutsia ilealis]|uniref:phage head closure protein n=1 Tax=Romboutsia ilealis TaxID=1115758 RepID=UPI002572A990|nr:phage head closure protein [Romboutsia ilealis]
MFSEVIELIDIISKVDENGFEINEEIKTEVFANKKSISASEFYESQKLGYKLSVMFEIRVSDFDEHEFILYENKKYKIERTYQKNTEILEIVCSKVV